MMKATNQQKLEEINMKINKYGRGANNISVEVKRIFSFPKGQKSNQYYRLERKCYVNVVHD